MLNETSIIFLVCVLEYEVLFFYHKIRTSRNVAM